MAHAKTDLYPLVDSKLWRFIDPLRIKIKEHQAWFDEKRITVHIGSEIEWGWGDYAVHQWKGQLAKAENSGAYFSEKTKYTLEWSGRSGDEAILETRGYYNKNPIWVCDNVYAIRRDVCNAGKATTHPKICPEIVSNHYHISAENSQTDIVRKPANRLRGQSEGLIVGLVGMADMALPFCVPLTYLINMDGITDQFGFSENQDESHRYVPKYQTVEQRSNLKGSEGFPELAVCQILGAIRWGITQQQQSEKSYQFYRGMIGGKKTIPFLPEGKKWDEYYAGKLTAMRENPAVMECFGEDTAHGLLAYFQKRLEIMCDENSLKTIRGKAKETGRQ